MHKVIHSEALTRALQERGWTQKDLAREMGVTFRLSCIVREIRATGDRITGIATDQGILDADLYVLALGSFSPLLARSLGLRLPIVPAKGFSATVPMSGLRASTINSHAGLSAVPQPAH